MMSEVQIRPGITLPLSALRFEFVRSGGPGGQHVNKVSTAVILLFDVNKLQGLTDDQRVLLQSRLKSRIGADGILKITVRSSRSQWRNRQAAVERLIELLRSALKETRVRRKTLPTKSSSEKRLRSKKHISAKKTIRRAQPE